uniref:Uncharacterized protein n=1 Tax=Podoviridae sp. ctuQh21 TaxID=2825284 RepID=A0A8S5PGJ8_9CAUD|nr:MAG TPA: hypothetical protein [Podoviridae sp. ctuQh21]DAT30009.1 MAG TPA: hypothetical protein [Caudoviricetes sp.]
MTFYLPAIFQMITRSITIAKTIPITLKIV